MKTFQTEYIKSILRSFVTSLSSVRSTKYYKSGNFLEIGFGDNNLLQLFMNDFSIFGADVSDYDYVVAKMVKQYDKSENFKLCDVSKERIPFEHRFDVICAINNIEHLANPKFTSENIYEKLNPGGILLIQVPTKSNILSKLQYKFFYDVPEYIYRPSIKMLNNFFPEIGFKKLKQFIPTFLPFKIGNQFLVESFNLYFAIFQKPKLKILDKGDK